MATIMLDHPGWATTDHGSARVMRSGSSTWLLTCGPHTSGVEMSVVDGPPDGPLPNVIRVDKPIPVESELGSALAPFVPLLRVRNASLWDAIGNAILQQVIKSDRARLTYQKFCLSCSDPTETPSGLAYLFPDPECVLRIPATVFAALEMSFTRTLLRRAARAYLENEAAWSQLEPVTLVGRLQSIPGIGPWTAGASVADFSGDFSVYPYSDKTIRTLAQRAAPATTWPDNTRQFRARWQATAGNDISGLTQLMLTWGNAERPSGSAGTEAPTTEQLPAPVDLLAVLRDDEMHRKIPRPVSPGRGAVDSWRRVGS